MQQVSVDATMAEITDEDMKARLQHGRGYATALLRRGPVYEAPEKRSPEQAKIVWEHVRRNMRLSAEGIMALVGPVMGGDVVGIAVFTVPADEARALMDEDPGVKAGVFGYELVTWFEFPGDGLPPA